MNEARWFVLCLVSGSCLGIGAVALATAEWLIAGPFVLAGLWYGRGAYKEAALSERRK